MMPPDDPSRRRRRARACSPWMPRRDADEPATIPRDSPSASRTRAASARDVVAHAGAGQSRFTSRPSRIAPFRHVGADDGHRRVQRRSVDAGAGAGLRSGHAHPRESGRVVQQRRAARDGHVAGLRRRRSPRIARRSRRTATRSASPTSTRSCSRTTRSRVASWSRRRPMPPPPPPIATRPSSRCARSAWTRRASPPCARTARDAPPQAVIRAPIDGTVVEKLINPGQLLQAGTTPCFTIADLSTMWVMANVFESDIGVVAAGADGRRSPRPRMPTPITGTVTTSASLVDPATKATAVRILAPNPRGVLKRDMFVHVAIRASAGAQRHSSFPCRRVLRDDQNLPFVYRRAPNNHFARRPITLGTRIGDSVRSARRASPPATTSSSTARSSFSSRRASDAAARRRAELRRRRARPPNIAERVRGARARRRSSIASSARRCAQPLLVLLLTAALIGVGIWSLHAAAGRRVSRHLAAAGRDRRRSGPATRRRKSSG